MKKFTKNTWLGHTWENSEALQCEDNSKGADILTLIRLRTMPTRINQYHWHKQGQCSRFYQNVLPEDGPVWPKHVAKKIMYFNDILRTFQWHFSDLNVILVSSKTKSVLHYRWKRAQATFQCNKMLKYNIMNFHVCWQYSAPLKDYII
jgi:hypothetical protein